MNITEASQVNILIAYLLGLPDTLPSADDLSVEERQIIRRARVREVMMRLADRASARLQAGIARREIDDRFEALADLVDAAHGGGACPLSEQTCANCRYCAVPAVGAGGDAPPMCGRYGRATHVGAWCGQWAVRDLGERHG